MKYTIILTEESHGHFRAMVPGLPDCTIHAQSRSEALDLIHERITQFLKRSEIIQLDVPRGSKSAGLQRETPWELFGAFKDDPTWGDLFDTIEQQRNSHEG